MNWPEVTIESICETTSGGTPSREHSRYYGGGVPWVKSGELRENTISETEETISEEALRNSSAKLLPRGTLLIAMYGATVGRMATLGVQAATNQAVCALTPRNGEIDGRFLFYSLRSKIPEMLTRRIGGAQPNISQGIIRSLKIYLPSKDEQKRIAAILDKAETILRKREQAIKLADEFLRSLFLDMFGDPIRNPKGWPTSTLSSLSLIRSGVTKGRTIKGQAFEVPYMRVANVQDGHMDLSEIKTIAATEEEITRYSLLPGDVLLTEGGDPDKLGRGAVWDSEIPQCIHQNHVFCVRPNGATVLPQYLSALLGSALGKRYFLKAAKQTTGIASINKTQLSGFPVLVPDIILQQTYSKAVKDLKVLNEHQQQQIKQCTSLSASLMHSAFRR